MLDTDFALRQVDDGIWAVYALDPELACPRVVAWNHILVADRLISHASALDLPQPTRELGEHGLDLWTAVQSDYVIEDSAGIETLMTACQALDRAEALAQQILADGPIVHGLKAHPAIAGEAQNRGLVVRCLKMLGLLHQPIGKMGPGPKRHPSKHWESPDDDQ